MKLKLLLLFALISVSGCSVVNTLRMKSANDDISPEWQNNAEQQIFDAVYIGEKPYIQASVNGVSLLFLIDTGASFSMLFDTPKVKSIPHDKGFELTIAGWGTEQKTKGYQTSITEMSLGNVAFREVKMAYIPISQTKYYLTKEEAIFDGVIGHDLLRHFAWVFDKRSGTITAHRASVIDNNTAYAVPFEMSFSKPYIPAQVAFNDAQRFDTQVIIDSGSRHYLKLNTAYIEANDVVLSTSIKAADFGLSGMVEHQRVVVDSLRIGDNVMANVKANIIPSDDEDDWWVIGSALMNQYVSTIDYHASLFALTPYPHAQFESRFNLSGLELRKLSGGNFIVRYIFEGFDASTKPITVGDVITQINGVDSTDISEEEWLRLISLPQTLSVCLAEKSCYSIALRHITGYSTKGASLNAD
ncbi:aspartyl protease family protein [Alteromonas facilis]|uniref:aspartyl protease family protein n=1 Tax=Alteromonas facilis TaxID=2048004 RepID=UPI0013DCF83C|nr:aspartyl protease family protein [Alteromonas facilis]